MILVSSKAFDQSTVLTCGTARVIGKDRHRALLGYLIPNKVPTEVITTVSLLDRAEPNAVALP